MLRQKAVPLRPRGVYRSRRVEKHTRAVALLVGGEAGLIGLHRSHCSALLPPKWEALVRNDLDADALLVQQMLGFEGIIFLAWLLDLLFIYNLRFFLQGVRVVNVVLRLENALLSFGNVVIKDGTIIVMLKVKRTIHSIYPVHPIAHSTSSILQLHKPSTSACVVIERLLRRRLGEMRVSA